MRYASHCQGTHRDRDRDWRQLVEENRRELVSEGVRAAYRAGRNTANKNRARAKTWALAKMKTANAKVIANSSMTAAAIAEHVVRAGTNYGLGRRAIGDEISRLRKERLQGQMAGKIDPL